jgi:hypothetical protein
VGRLRLRTVDHPRVVSIKHARRSRSSRASASASPSASPRLCSPTRSSASPICASAALLGTAGLVITTSTATGTTPAAIEPRVHTKTKARPSRAIWGRMFMDASRLGQAAAHALKDRALGTTLGPVDPPTPRSRRSGNARTVNSCGATVTGRGESCSGSSQPLWLMTRASLGLEPP